jgi:predicted GNAT family N-acyltransferase
VVPEREPPDRSDGEPPDREPQVELVPVDGPGDFAAALAIREVVFIEEQQVPREIERDDEDPTAYHLLAQVGGHAIGTGRLVELREPPPGEQGRWGQIGRMAVLVSNRRGKVGSKILSHLEDEARRRGLTGVVLHAQVYAHGFYKTLGYEDASPIFDEAGIPHVEMRKRLA